MLILGRIREGTTRTEAAPNQHPLHLQRSLELTKGLHRHYVTMVWKQPQEEVLFPATPYKGHTIEFRRREMTCLRSHSKGVGNLLGALPSFHSLYPVH